MEVGSKAPLFQAESTHGQVDLGGLIGKQPVVLIFYPKDETPVCTKQLCAVRDALEQYNSYNAAVLGINPGTLNEHQTFAANHGYNFPIVSDDRESIRKAYDVGKILGLFAQLRIVYVIGLDGHIQFAEKGNRSTGEILGALKQAALINSK